MNRPCESLTAVADETKQPIEPNVQILHRIRRDGSTKTFRV
ncbi:hypothetical protein RSSM_00538 [Rhodopirellula sallentina SM41]|uniref:Uncharacterized protein n=1 Tax=Rhodopirellula sallentina SM41 TaxID=1263870 RepID=M5U9N5_9BACT|nr:hypothetical protein RSSM_00538 [Rhodopirellula sallentina SM41]